MYTDGDVEDLSLQEIRTLVENYGKKMSRARTRDKKKVAKVVGNAGNIKSMEKIQKVVPPTKLAPRIRIKMSRKLKLITGAVKDGEGGALTDPRIDMTKNDGDSAELKRKRVEKPRQNSADEKADPELKLSFQELREDFIKKRKKTSPGLTSSSNAISNDVDASNQEIRRKVGRPVGPKKKITLPMHDLVGRQSEVRTRNAPTNKARGISVHSTLTDKSGQPQKSDEVRTLNKFTQDKKRLAAQTAATQYEQERLAAEGLSLKDEEERLAAEALALKQEEERLTAVALGKKQGEERLVAEARTEQQDQERLAAIALAKKQGEEHLAALAKQKEQNLLAAEALVNQHEQERLAAEVLALVHEEERLVLALVREEERLAAKALALKHEAKRLVEEALAEQKEEERLAAVALAKKQEEERLAALAEQKEQDRLAAEALVKQHKQERLAAKALPIEEEEGRLAAVALAEQQEEERLVAIALAKKQEEEHLAALAEQKEQERLAAEAPVKQHENKVEFSTQVMNDSDATMDHKRVMSVAETPRQVAALKLPHNGPERRHASEIYTNPSTGLVRPFTSGIIPSLFALEKKHDINHDSTVGKKSVSRASAAQSTSNPMEPTIRRSRRQRYVAEDADGGAKFGQVGYIFSKFFPGYGRFKGMVVEISPNWIRRCAYSDGDQEDLTLRELKHLSKLDEETSFAQPLPALPDEQVSGGKLLLEENEAADSDSVSNSSEELDFDMADDIIPLDDTAESTYHLEREASVNISKKAEQDNSDDEQSAWLTKVATLVNSKAAKATKMIKPILLGSETMGLKDNEEVSLSDGCDGSKLIMPFEIEKAVPLFRIHKEHRHGSKVVNIKDKKKIVGQVSCLD